MIKIGGVSAEQIAVYEVTKGSGTNWCASWRHGEKMHTVHLGSCKRMDKEATLAIARKKKAQDLELEVKMTDEAKLLKKVDDDSKDDAVREAYIHRGLEKALDRANDADVADATRKSEERKNEPF